LTAALDRPNITVYGPTDPGLIGGYGKNQMVCRAPRENLINLNSQAVLEKLSSL
ncbi:lipopolysaccharide heptosyltransferase 1, partial [Escherichia coli]|nr:lipopolysaccharide heptosyltransferase 1 [Escherichia coli]